MEMHQIRYFLALAECLNFTRAAEQCHVAQPSLTRGIKQLEDELGGELFRRENKGTHLTPFGHRMMPFLRQSYEAARTAKEVASVIRRSGSAPVVVALSKTIDVSLLGGPLAELYRAFPTLQVRFVRCDAERLVAILREGGADLALAADLPSDWDRLDSWPLFPDGFSCVTSASHPLTDRPAVALADLHGERLIGRPYCETLQSLLATTTPARLSEGMSEADSDEDALRLVEMDLGIAIMPDSWKLGGTLRRVPIDDPDLIREVKLHVVSGRRWSPATALLMKLLRARDWTASLARAPGAPARRDAVPA